VDVSYSNTAYIGHAAATALIGLALGLARLLAGRLGVASRRDVAYALPLAAWLWVVVDHALFNHVAGTGRMSGVVKFLYTIDGMGRLSSWALYLLLAGTLVYERLILRRYRGRRVGTPWSGPTSSWSANGGRGCWTSGPRRWSCAFTCGGGAD
jgi:hypothetical protein